MHNLTGQKFGRLTVVSRGPTNGHIYWVCTCECGGTATVASNRLRLGRTTSCGCARGTHHESKSGSVTPMYRVWMQMRERCNNPKSKSYKNYGGRGITVCPEWDSYPQFAADMGERPPGHSLDRKDNDGPYAPWNCRWATALEQMANTRAVRVICFDGRVQHLSAWAREFGVPVPTLHTWLWKYGEAEAMNKALRRGSS
jgi:hypothetical protein